MKNHTELEVQKIESLSYLKFSMSLENSHLIIPDMLNDQEIQKELRSENLVDIFSLHGSKTKE